MGGEGGYYITIAEHFHSMTNRFIYMLMHSERLSRWQLMPLVEKPAERARGAKKKGKFGLLPPCRPEGVHVIQ